MSEQAPEQEPELDGKLGSAIKQVGMLDTLFTEVKKLWKKHWGIILVCLVGLFLYWAFNLPDVESEVDSEVPPSEEVWEYEIAINGDTVWYLNGERYEEAP